MGAEIDPNGGCIDWLGFRLTRMEDGSYFGRTSNLFSEPYESYYARLRQIDGKWVATIERKLFAEGSTIENAIEELDKNIEIAWR